MKTKKIKKLRKKLAKIRERAAHKILMYVSTIAHDVDEIRKWPRYTFENGEWVKLEGALCPDGAQPNSDYVLVEEPLVTWPRLKLARNL